MKHFSLRSLLIFVFLAAPPLAAVGPEILAIEPPDGTLQTTGEVRLRGRIAGATRLLVDGEEIPLVEGSFVTEPYQLSEGDRVFLFAVEDDAGHKVERLHRIVLDTRGPELRISRPARTVVSSSPVEVRGMAVDPHLSAVSVDGRPVTLDGPSFAASVELEEGERTVVIEARDAAGHASRRELRLTLDTRPPVVDVRMAGKSLVDGTAFSEAVLPEIVADSAARVDVLLNGTRYEPGRRIDREGTHTLTVRAHDEAGHTTVHQVSFQVDGTPPRFAPLPKALTVGSASYTVRGRVSGAAKVLVNGRPARLEGESFTAGPFDLSRGDNVFDLEATDPAGNNAAAQLVVKLDTSAPTITITSPPEGSVMGSSPVTVAGTVTDDAVVTEVKIGATLGTLAGDQFTISDVTLTEGANALTVEATDDSANTSQAVLNLTLDTTAPTIQVLADGSPIADGTVFPGLVTPVIQVTDATAVTVESTLDSLAWTSNTSVTSSGSHVLAVSATDEAGNSASKNVTFTVEAAPPVFESLSPATGTVQSAALVTLVGRVTGASQVTVDGVAVALVGADFVAGPYDLTSDADRTFTLIATSAGSQTTQQILTVTRDVTAPALAFSSPADGAVVDTVAVSVTGTASDLHLDQVTVNDRQATLTAGTFQADQIALAEGENLLRARAVDEAGNVTELERTVVLDSLAPEVTITDPAVGTVVGEATYTLSGAVREAHLDRVEVAGQAAALTGEQWSVTISLVEGDNDIVVEAYDTLGHRGEAMVTIARESGAPDIHMDLPEEGFATASPTVDVSGTFDVEVSPETGAVLTTVTVNGVSATANADGTFALTGVALVEGDNRIVARALDSLSRQGIHTRDVVRDTEGPSFVASEPVDGAFALPASATFQLTFSEPLADPAAGSWILRTGAGTALPATAAVADEVLRLTPQPALPLATDLELELNLGLTDRVGNTLVEARTLTFSTDDGSSVAGAPVISPPPPLYLCANSWTLQGTADPEGWVRVEGGASIAEGRADAGGTFSLVVALLPDRLHRLSVTSTDLDSNVSPATVVDVVQDCTPPTVVSAERQVDDFVVTFSEPVDGATVSPAITLSAAGTGVAGTVTSTGAAATFSPTSTPPAGPLRLEVSEQVVDLAGNALAYPYSQIFDEAPEESFVSGTVIDNATGRPLPGARVVVTATDGVALAEPLPEQTTAVDGRFLIPVGAGTHDLTVARPGYTPVFRIATASTGVGTEIFAPRLTPASDPENVGTSGATVTSEGATLDVPTGALAAAAAVALTPVDEQGLAALLPYGWSPRGAVWLEIDADLQVPVPLSFPVESADGTLLTVAELDLATLQWRSLGDVAVADGQVTVSVSALGAYAALEADSGSVAPPAAISGEVLGSSPTPTGTLVASAAVTFDPEVVLPTQTSLATLIYTLTDEVASGLPLTVVIQEELTLLDGTVRREAPYRADLVLFQTSGGASRSRFRLQPSVVAQTTPIQLGAEDVEVQRYADESVRGNVLGPEGGTVLGDEGDRIDVPAGSLLEPTAIVITRRTVADLPMAVPAGGTVDGVVEIDLGGTVMLSPGRITLTMDTPPAAGEVGLLLQVVDVDGTPLYRAIAELEPSASGWASKAINPADLPWPGVREGGQYVFVHLTTAQIPVTGTVRDVENSVLAGALVSSPAVDWIQLSDDQGRFVLPLPPGEVTLDVIDPVTGDATSKDLTIDPADPRVDVEPRLDIVAPQVVETTPVHGAVVPAGVTPTVRFSEAVDPASVPGSVQLLNNGRPVPVDFDVQGALVTVLPLATLAAGTAYDLRVGTTVLDLQGYALLLPYEVRFTISEVVLPSEVDRSKVLLLEPDAAGLAHIVGEPGAVPSGALVWVENLTSYESTPSANAAQDGSFNLSIGSTLEDRLLFHILISGANEVFFELDVFLTADRRGAWVGSEAAELTTVDGWTVLVSSGTFSYPTRIHMEPIAPAALSVPLPPDMTAIYGFDLELTSEPSQRLGLRFPAPAGATASQSFLLERTVEIFDQRGWMLHELLELSGGELTNLDASGQPRALNQLSAPGVLDSKSGHPAEHLVGIDTPGEFTLSSTDVQLALYGVPAIDGAVFSNQWRGQIAYATALISGLPGTYAILPAPLGSVATFDVVELSTGFRSFRDVSFDVSVPFQVVPGSSFDDQKPPFPMIISPFRVLILDGYETDSDQIVDGIYRSVTNGEMAISADPDTTLPGAPIRLIGLDDTASVEVDANATGGFGIVQPVTAGYRYLLVIGADVASDERIDITFNELISNGTADYDILSSTGTAVDLDVESSLRRPNEVGLRPLGGWVVGERYTLKIRPTLQDAKGNQWGRTLTLPFTATGISSQPAFQLGFVRDVARIGDRLFVAADSQGLMVLDAGDPSALVNFLPGSLGFPLALNDPVRGVAVDAHDRVIFVGGGVTGFGQAKILDIRQVTDDDLEAVQQNPNAFVDVMTKAIRGSTILSDPIGESHSTLPGGLPRHIAVLSNDKADRWTHDREVSQPVEGLTVTFLGTPQDEQAMLHVAGGDAIAGNPVTLRNLTRGVSAHTDAGAGGSYDLQVRVRDGDEIVLLRNLNTMAFISIDGVGIVSVPVNAFYDFNFDNPNQASWILGKLDHLEVPPDSGCSAIPPQNPWISGLEVLPPSGPYPATLSVLLQNYGVANLAIEGTHFQDLRLISSHCGKVDGLGEISDLGVANLADMSFVRGYGFDLDGDGDILTEDEVDEQGNVGRRSELRDYVVVVNPAGWLLVFDTTDRAALTLVGKVKMPGPVKAVAIDTDQRRLVVSGTAGIYIVEFDQPPSLDVPPGDDPRVLELLPLQGGTSDRAILIPELGLAYVGSPNGLVRGVLSGPGFQIWSHDMKRRLTWIAPYGVPDGGGAGAIRFRVAIPGDVGDAQGQVKVDLLSVGPGGKEIFGAGTLSGHEFPPTSLTEADGLVLYRQSNDPLDDAYDVFVSEVVVLMADLRAVRDYPLADDEKDRCSRCDNEEDLPDWLVVSGNYRELLSGDYLQLKIPAGLRTQLLPIWGSILLDRSEPKVRSISWRMTPPARPEPTVNPSYGSGDVAPGTLLHSGEMTLTEGDLVIKRRGFPFALLRTYRSQTIGYGVLGPGWLHSYEMSLRLLPDNAVEFYDGRGRVETFTARKVQREYAGETVTGVEWQAPRGRFMTLSHPTEDSWLLVDDRARKIRFDGDGRLVSISDVLAEDVGLGNEMRFYYNAKSQLTEIVDTLGLTYQLQYRDDGLLERVTDPELREVVYDYDAYGRLTSCRSPRILTGETPFSGGLVETYEYADLIGGYGEQIQERDSLISVTDPKGQKWLELTHTDPDGDGYDNEVTAQVWGGHSLTISYGFDSRITTVTDRRSNICTYEHNQEGQVTKVTDPTGAVNSWEYNYDGMVTAQTRPLSGRIDNVYETEGGRRSGRNLKQTILRSDSRGANGSSAELATTRDYDPRVNQVTTTTQPWGTTLSVERDDYGQDKVIVEAEGTVDESSLLYEFNDYGQKTKETNANGNVTDYTYNDDGYLESSAADPGGLALVTQYETDKRGNVTAMVDPRGVRFEYVYNEVDWLVEERIATSGSNAGAPALNYVITYRYDENGNVVEKKIPFGNGSSTTSTRYEYDILNNVTATEKDVDATGVSFTRETREYDASFNLTRAIDPEGHVAEATYDSRNLVETETRGAGTPEASTTTYTYDAERQVTTVLDGRGKTWSIEYDGYGRVMKEVDPLGNYTHRTYDDAGNVASTKSYDAGGNLLARTEVEYDQLNRSKARKIGHWFAAESQSDITTSLAYDAASNVLTSTDERQYATSYLYDAAERLYQTSDPQGNVAAMTLDGNGNVTFVNETDVFSGGGSVQLTRTYKYDALGRLIETTESDGRTWKSEYDARSNVTKEVDPDLNETTYEYDGLNRLTRVSRPENVQVDYTYDLDSRMVSYRDALNQTTSYAYDALERPLTVTFPDSTVVATLAYDGNDNPLQVRDARDNLIIQTFDDANRLVGRSVTLASGVGGVSAESFVYDGLDRLTSVTSGVTVSRAYDSLSRLRSETIDGKTVQYRYDNASNLEALTYPSAYEVTYQNDGLNRRTQISSGAGPVAGYGYRGPYLVAQKSLYGPGPSPALDAGLSFDPTRRLLRKHCVKASDSATVFDENLTWYARNLKQTSVRDDLDGRQLSYTYDGADRLTDVQRQAVVSTCQKGLPRRWAYGYDVADNLLSKTEERETCDAETVIDLPLDGSGRNRPGAVDLPGTGDDLGLGWDASGNLTSKGGSGFQYDYRNRLIRATVEGAQHDYVYDHFNRRVEKSGGGQVEKTVWAGWQEIETYVNDQLTERRTYGNGLDEIVRLEKLPSGDVYLPIYDDSGNLVLVTAETGEPVERYEYSPFGQRFIFADTAPPAVEQVRFKSNGASLEIWVEVSEEIDETVLQQEVSSGALRLSDLDAGVDLAISVSQPVLTGRQARRRLIITTTDPPAADANVELVIPAAALVDKAEQTAAADYVTGFQWPAGETIVEDTVAPRLDTVCVQGDHLEIQLSEEPDLTQFPQVVTVNGLELTWTLGADRYTLISQTLSEGSHSLSIPSGLALDLNGLGLTTSYSASFEITSEPVNQVLFDSLRPGQLAESAIGVRHGFQGRPVDPETGFVYFRNRYYDPELGRFISTDPQEYGDSPSLYQFALNNPVNFGDPTGEVVETAWDALSLTLGFNSLVTNLKEGNLGMAALDAFGVLVDAAAVALPGIPGGVGVALKACRAATVIDMVQAVDAGVNAAMSANAAYQSFEQGDVGAGLFNAGLTALGARGVASNVRSAGRGCLFNCFAEGTLVLTEDGERPIEEIEVGDRVWAWNEETGETELAKVVRLFEREALEVYTLYVSAGEVLETTDEHPFWVVGRGWVEVDDLQPGDILTTYEDTELRLVAVERQERSLRVYNFEVRGLHTYFVGDVRVLVHNCQPQRISNKLPPSTHGRVMGEIVGGKVKMRDRITPTGRFDFVVGIDGRILLGRKHTFITGGADVQAAGEIRVRNGKIVNISNASGHYMPTIAETSNFLRVLRQSGADVSRATLQILGPNGRTHKHIHPTSRIRSEFE